MVQRGHWKQKIEKAWEARPVVWLAGGLRDGVAAGVP